MQVQQKKKKVLATFYLFSGTLLVRVYCEPARTNLSALNRKISSAMHSYVPNMMLLSVFIFVSPIACLLRDNIYSTCPQTFSFAFTQKEKRTESSFTFFI